jgi:hypothetical protein
MAAGDFTVFGIINKLPANPLRSLYDNYVAPETKAHATWYDETLPTMLDKYKKEIGSKRSAGTMRDIAAEFIGAADYAQRYSGTEDQARLNANLYQYLNHGITPDADANRFQDKAGLAFGMQNKNMSKEDLVKAGIEWAKRTSPSAPIDNSPYYLDTRTSRELD